jgi:hypothetical protein
MFKKYFFLQKAAQKTLYGNYSCENSIALLTLSFVVGRKILLRIMSD